MPFPGALGGLMNTAMGNSGFGAGAQNAVTGFSGPMFQQGSQNLSAPALATLLGSQYIAPPSQPWSPGPEEWREYMKLMKEMSAPQGMPPWLEGLLPGIMPQNEGASGGGGIFSNIFRNANFNQGQGQQLPFGGQSLPYRNTNLNRWIGGFPFQG